MELLVGFIAAEVLITLLIVAQIMNKVTRLERALIQSGVIRVGELSNRVKEIASDPTRKIEAIKAHRKETGCGLAEAKEAVEAYIRSQNP